MKKYDNPYLDIVKLDNVQDILTASPAKDEEDNLINWSDLQSNPVNFE